MLDRSVLRKLESVRELPTIPYIISEVLNSLENPDASAGSLAELIERDQTLTARVLKVANSPFYGFVRRISTIDLAVVVLGLEAIKEIVLSLIVQRLFSKVRKDIFDINSFWQYSIYSGAASRVLARKLGYRLAGEAFVSGLMHDIGILILIGYFTDKFVRITEMQKQTGIPLKEAELKILNCTHGEIGHWLASKWNLPENICQAILHHHDSYVDVANAESDNEKDKTDGDTMQLLTAIVALAEWFSMESDYKKWSMEVMQPQLYLANEVISSISRENDILSPDSVIEVMKQEILVEYERASVLSKIPVRPLY